MSQKIIDRIRKLLAKARDESVTPEEAAAFAAKASQMLIEHGLTEEGLVERTQSLVDKTIWRHIYHGDAERKAMFFSACPAFMCKGLTTKTAEIYTDRKGVQRLRTQTSYLIVGRPIYAETIISVLGQIFETIVRMSQQYSKDRKQQLAFRRGAGVTICRRFQELVESRAAPTSDSRALVLVSSELSEAEDWIKLNLTVKQNKPIQISQGKGAAAQNAFYEGYDAAKNIPITQLIEGDA